MPWELPDDPPEYELIIANPSQFTRELKSLGPDDTSTVDVAIRNLLTVDPYDLLATDWLKKISPELWEFRIGKTTTAVFSKIGLAPPEGFRPGKILVRVFCSFQRGRVSLLLSAYDKGRDPSPKRQQREIEKARRILATWKQENH